MDSRYLIFEDYTDSEYDTAKLNTAIVRCQEIKARIRLLVDSDARLSKKNERIKNDAVELISYCVSIAQVMKSIVTATVNDNEVMVALSFSSKFIMGIAETLQFAVACEKADGIAIIPASKDCDQTIINFKFNISEYVKNDG